MDSQNPKINPEYYRRDKVQLIDFLKVFLSPEEFKGFCKGLILKYVVRADQKNVIEDYMKAQWYLEYLVNYLKENHHDNS